ncbi:MAG: hypothetical protein JWM58_126 [Rhizobium sp.]|nr:hypothetical protein [Rhizobium sp.]
MIIRAPRQEGEYPDRDLDCQEAIEKAFLAQTAIAGAAFIDLKRVRSAITADAVSAGWSDVDVESAVSELARCYALKVARINNDDFSTAAAVARSIMRL